MLRLKRARHPDAVCIERLEQFLREEQERRAAVLLAGVQPDTLAVLKNTGLLDWFPSEQIFLEEEAEFSATLKAVRHARSLLASHAAGKRGESEGGRLYYLV